MSVVGESHYQPAIASAVAGRRVPRAGNWDDALSCDAALVPEPDNPYDPSAVRVDLSVEGGWVTVGYISRANAVDYQPVLGSMTSKGQLPCVPARICRSSGGLAVYLHLAEADRCVPHNQQPPGIPTLVPETACAVTAENRYQQALESFQPSAGERLPLWATLHHGVVPSGKHAGEPTLEVRLDGSCVGVLSATQGERYRRLVRDNMVMACEAEVYQGSKNLEVRVFLPILPPDVTNAS